jgi:hypothetical protein
MDKKRAVPLTPACHEGLRIFLREHSALQVLVDRHVTLQPADGTPRFWVSSGGPLGDAPRDGTLPKFAVNVLNRSDAYRGQFLPSKGQDLLWGVQVSGEAKEALGTRPWPLAGPERPIPKYNISAHGFAILQVRPRVAPPPPYCRLHPPLCAGLRLRMRRGLAPDVLLFVQELTQHRPLRVIVKEVEDVRCRADVRQGVNAACFTFFNTHSTLNDVKFSKDGAVVRRSLRVGLRPSCLLAFAEYCAWILCGCGDVRCCCALRRY